MKRELVEFYINQKECLGQSQTRMTRIRHDVKVTSKGCNKIREVFFFFTISESSFMKTKKSAKENPDSKSIAFITKCHFAFSTKNTSSMISNLIMIYIKREKKGRK